MNKITFSVIFPDSNQQAPFAHCGVRYSLVRYCIHPTGRAHLIDNKKANRLGLAFNILFPVGLDFNIFFIYVVKNRSKELAIERLQVFDRLTVSLLEG
jgi:hypothetical protein